MSSQVITLYITPVVYTYMDALQARLSRRKDVRVPVRSDAPAGAVAAG